MAGIIKSTQYHTLSISITNDVHGDKASDQVRTREVNTRILDTLAEELPDIVANITRYRNVELILDTHNYQDLEKEIG